MGRQNGGGYTQSDAGHRCLAPSEKCAFIDIQRSQRQKKCPYLPLEGAIEAALEMSTLVSKKNSSLSCFLCELHFEIRVAEKRLFATGAEQPPHTAPRDSEGRPQGTRSVPSGHLRQVCTRRHAGCCIWTSTFLSSACLYDRASKATGLMGG